MAVARQKRGMSRIKASASTAAPDFDPTHTLTAIANVVEAEIVPRLLAAHHARNHPAPPADAAAPDALVAAPIPADGALPNACQEGAYQAGASEAVAAVAGVSQADARLPDAAFIAAFTAELIRGDHAAIRERIEELSQSGLSAESLCLQVLAPVARHLGDLWNDDACSFVDVTTGTALLHGIMNGLRPALCYGAVDGVRPRCAMLVTAPGEQHRFGVSMLAEFFRNDQWQVSLPTGRTIAQIAALAAARPIDMVGFSAGSDRQLGALAACIAAVRASSYNPDILVMVGGPIFAARPDLVRLVGADATASNAEEAVHCAGSLLQARRAAVAKRVARVRSNASARITVSAAARGREPSHAQ